MAPEEGSVNVFMTDGGGASTPCGDTGAAGREECSGSGTRTGAPANHRGPGPADPVAWVRP